MAAQRTAEGLLKSAYEIARDERIAANKDVLRQLGLLGNKAPGQPSASSSKTKEQPEKKAKKREKEQVEPQRKTKTRKHRRSKRLRHEDAEFATKDITAAETAAKPVRARIDYSKYERLAAMHARDWDEETMGKLPQTATYEHTVMRVKTMAPKALSTRVRVIEKARGKFCVTKMQMFAEVLILEGYDDIADEAKAALHRLLNGIPPPC